MPNGGGGLAEGLNDNIGGDGIGFVTNAHACDDARKAGVVKRLECYSSQVMNLRKKKPKKVTREKARNRVGQEENLLKKIRSLFSLHPWLKREYSHLIPDGVTRQS